MKSKRIHRLRTLTVVTLLAGLLAGCATNLGASTYDPRRSCESFGQIYRESDGTCRGGGA